MVALTDELLDYFGDSYITYSKECQDFGMASFLTFEQYVDMEMKFRQLEALGSVIQYAK